MLYLGCDVHKNYTTVSFVDENGNTKETRSFFNNIDELKHLLSLFPEEEFSAVLEAGLNWGLIYDMLESIEEVRNVSLAHPPKVKAIASARIKTDKIDSSISYIRPQFNPASKTAENSSSGNKLNRHFNSSMLLKKLLVSLTSPPSSTKLTVV